MDAKAAIIDAVHQAWLNCNGWDQGEDGCHEAMLEELGKAWVFLIHDKVLDRVIVAQVARLIGGAEECSDADAVRTLLDQVEEILEF